MKLTIDTQLKAISLHEDVNAEELFATLENFLPNGLWKEFKISVNVIKDWSNPIVIPCNPIQPSNPNPFPLDPLWPISPQYPGPTYPWITYGQHTGTNDGGVTFTALNAGVYNVEFAK